jgi:hypothetical protein
MRPGKRNSLRHLLELQRSVFAAATKEGVEPRELAQLAGAFVRLEDQKRILKGRPLPGSLKPEKPVPRRTPAHLLPFSEE